MRTHCAQIAQGLWNVTHDTVNFATIDQYQRAIRAQAVVRDVRGEIETHHLICSDDVYSERVLMSVG